MSQTSDPTGQQDAAKKTKQKPINLTDEGRPATNKMKLAPGFYQDFKEKHLYLRVSPNGKRVWVFYGQAPSEGKVVKKNLDQSDAELVSVAAARGIVKEMDVGYSKKNATLSTSEAPTFEEVVLMHNRGWLTKALKRDFNAWSNKRLDEITPFMVVQREAQIRTRASAWSKERDEMAGKPQRANPGEMSVSDAAKALRKIYNAAAEGHWRYKGENLGKLMKVSTNPPRDRVLDEEEQARVRDVLANWETHGFPSWVPVFFGLLPMTGTRWGAFLKSGRWDQIKWRTFEGKEVAMWSIPATVAKRRKEDKVAFNADAAAILKKWREESTGPWIFPSESDPTKPRNNPEWWWDKLKEAAQLEGVTLHDFRRTYVTNMVKKGVHHKVIAEMVNHSDTKMVDRVYSKINDEQKFAALMA